MIFDSVFITSKRLILGSLMFGRFRQHGSEGEAYLELSDISFDKIQELDLLKQRTCIVCGA